MSKAQLTQELEGICRETLTKRNWNTFDDFNIKLVPTSAEMMAYINTADRQITIQLGEDIHKQVDAFVRKENLPMQHDTALRTLVTSLMLHEHGHHEFCPGTKEGMDEIVAGLNDVVGKKEVSQKEIQAKCFYLHNLFSDTVLNTVTAHRDEENEMFKKGYGLTQLFAAGVQKTGNPMIDFFSRGDKAFTVFLRSNYALMGVDKDLEDRMRKNLAMAYFAEERNLAKLLKIFTRSDDISERALHRTLTRDDTDSLVSTMLDKEQWREMARQYAEIMYPLMRKPQKHINHNQNPRKGSSGSPQQGGPGGEQRGSGQEIEGEGSSGNKKGSKKAAAQKAISVHSSTRFSRILNPSHRQNRMNSGNLMKNTGTSHREYGFLSRTKKDLLKATTYGEDGRVCHILNSVRRKWNGARRR